MSLCERCVAERRRLFDLVKTCQTVLQSGLRLEFSGVPSCFGFFFFAMPRPHLALAEAIWTGVSRLEAARFP